MSQLLHQVTKVLEFQLQHQSFQWTPSTDLLQGGLVGSACSPRDSQSILQHHNPKAPILQRSAFFIVQLSHPYMTTGKTIALTRQTFAGKVMSLLFDMLSRLVITFLPKIPKNQLRNMYLLSTCYVINTTISIKCLPSLLSRKLHSG